MDIQGLGAIRAIRDRQKSISDVRVISLTGHSVGHMLETALTSMEMPAQTMGEAAAKSVIREILENPQTKEKPSHLRYESVLVPRESTR